jgi:hypothetical protein
MLRLFTLHCCVCDVLTFVSLCLFCMCVSLCPCVREDALLLLQRPLAQQVELLHLWHAALSTYLCTFLQQFKEASGRVMVAAGGVCPIAGMCTNGLPSGALERVQLS